MSKNIIIVFTRNPELGKVKTRLAQTIGNKATLEVYIQLLHHTEHVLNSLNCDVAVYYSETIIQDDIWNKKTYTKYLQNGDNLGERMYNAFKEQFNLHYNKVVIVGSDLFDLKPQHITNAFKALEQNDVVIGPAQDGGYYLLGMSTMIPQVFVNKTWSSPTVFEETLKDLQNLKVYLLEMLNDIDTFEDLKAHPELLKFISE
jgi:rSAM/selenodomain-associated transferase 1